MTFIVSLLIWILFFVLVVVLVKWVLGEVGAPANVQKIVLLILALLFVLWLFQGAMIMLPMPVRRF
jgi:hypothetical protein